MIQKLESFAKFLNTTQQKIDNLRIDNKKNIHFLQLGAGDGVKVDFVEKITDVFDFGILVEPCEETFQLLLKNKPPERFPHYTFKNCAVLPEKFSTLNLKFNVEICKMNGDIPTGNHFFPGQTRHGCNFIEKECTQISLKDFVKQNIQHPIDVLIIDIEGLDGDIIMEYVTLQQPPVIVFEFWEIIDEELGLKIETLETVQYTLNQLGYSIFGYKDDYCAFKPDGVYGN